ncbi:Pilus assembly protein [Candidatus Bealeia paramacronuclearis]|uniref:Pilus assembly protein n=1 Tax=Candidatus Bealeia paramacronuclearis TaxID=1921001 RepID=A0ABZ2C487_9PROT|nr:Pilus assembly protein [Candidatus Bealeia paramacronuclearis]
MKLLNLQCFVSHLKKFTHNDSGVVMVFIALAAVPMLAFAGLAIDASRVYYAQTVLTGAVDAAAIAAGRQSNATTATSEAKMAFNANLPPNFLATLPSNPLTVTTTGTQVTVASSGIVSTTLLQLVGENNVTVTASSLVDRSLSGLEVALVIDNTGSMTQGAGSGGLSKLAAVKSAANTLLNILYCGGTGTCSTTTQSGIYVALVPYTSMINIGTYDQEPTRWKNWLTSGGTPTTCLNSLGQPSAQCLTTIPSGVTTSPVISPLPQYGDFWSTSTRNVRGVRKTTYTDTGPWTGCTEARLDNALFSGVGNDGEGDDTPPDPANQATLWGAWDNIVGDSGTNIGGCPQRTVPLQNDITSIRNAITGLTAQGYTAINVGLAWGWRSLSPKWQNVWNGIYSSGSVTLPQAYNKTQKAIVLLTDGMNDLSGYSGYGSTTQAQAELGSVPLDTLNTRLANLCTRVKAQGITIFTVTVGSGSGAPDATVKAIMQNCATQASYYFDSPTTADLQGVFQNIGNTLQQLRFRTPGA